MANIAAIEAFDATAAALGQNCRASKDAIPLKKTLHPAVALGNDPAMTTSCSSSFASPAVGPRWPGSDAPRANSAATVLENPWVPLPLTSANNIC